jgi:hypothetical protein
MVLIDWSPRKRASRRAQKTAVETVSCVQMAAVTIACATRSSRIPKRPIRTSRAAAVRDGVLAVLVGVAARTSVASGKPVGIRELTDTPLQTVWPRS